jgi:hypothetical protein
LYEVLTEHYRPERWEQFPRFKIYNRSRPVCSHSWLETDNWLSYSPLLKGVVCRICVLFKRRSSTHDANNLGQLVVKPLENLKDATKILHEHEKTEYHKLSAVQAAEFLQRYVRPETDVNQLLLKKDADQQNKNRLVLKSITRCILLLSKQNISFRGRDDDGIPDSTSDHDSYGNFKELVMFAAQSGDSVLASHLQNCPRNAQYLSPDIQNEIIALCAKTVRNRILKDVIEQKKYYTIIADETSDISGRFNIFCKQQNFIEKI